MPIIKEIKILLEMIKFEHTIFALPFAYLGAFLGANGFPSFKVAALILMGMVGGRTAAMTFNRIVDLPFDAKNPRTATRALAKGTISKNKAWLMVFISCFFYFLAAYLLNPLAIIVSPFFLAIILLYSYTKRFSQWCHLFLGLALGLSPIAGWIAVTGALTSITPFILSIAVMFWVGGFDILYACLDSDFDKNIGLNSIPAKYGINNAFKISAFCHSLSFLFFVLIGMINKLGFIYFTGLFITLILMIMQRRVINPDNLEKMNMAFFTINSMISIVIFVFTVAALFVKF